MDISFQHGDLHKYT